MAMNKDMKKLLHEVERQGFTWEYTKNSHIRIRNAAGQTVTVTGGTASDPRSILNFKAALRRAGIVI